MDREQLAKISKKGGRAVSADADHMSRIGAKGGRNSGKVRKALVEIRRREKSGEL